MRIDNDVSMELVAFVPNHLLWSCSTSVLYSLVDFGYLLSREEMSPTFHLSLVKLSKCPVGELMCLNLSFREYSILDKCIIFFLCKKREREKRGGKTKRSYSSCTYNPGGNKARKCPLGTTT